MTMENRGWSGSYPKRDMRLGVDRMPAVNLVLITRKSRLNKARGFIETWVQGANGVPTERQSLVCVSLLVVLSSYRWWTLGLFPA